MTTGDDLVKINFSHEDTPDRIVRGQAPAQRKAIDYDSVHSPWLRGFVRVRTFFDFVTYETYLRTKPNENIIGWRVLFVKKQ